MKGTELLKLTHEELALHAIEGWNLAASLRAEHKAFYDATVKKGLEDAEKLTNALLQNRELECQKKGLVTALLLRRIHEPKHSEADHECAECMFLADLGFTEKREGQL